MEARRDTTSAADIEALLARMARPEGDPRLAGMEERVLNGLRHDRPQPPGTAMMAAAVVFALGIGALGGAFAPQPSHPVAAFGVPGALAPSTLLSAL